MVPLYLVFSKEFEDCLDFSDQMLNEQYLNESVGKPIKSTNNGYHYGKKYLDVTLAMWIEDIQQGNLFKSELYNDSKFPHWWLDKVLSNVLYCGFTKEFL